MLNDVKTELFKIAKELLYKDKISSEENRKAGKDFNIFDITTVSTHEVLMCRVVQELLNPNGIHGQGVSFLKDFCIDILKLNLTDDELRDITIYREYSIEKLDSNKTDNKKRRIDLVVANEKIKLFLPIEVKIYAGEQKNQCYDYLKYAKEKGNNELYYLTLYGDAPSKYSYKSEETLEAIKLISFNDEIMSWVKKCIEHSIEIEPLYHILLQLKNAIAQITYQNQGEINKMQDVIFKSNENFEAAKAISDCYQNAINTLIKKLFEKLIERIDINPKSEITIQTDMNYDVTKPLQKHCVKAGFKLNEFDTENHYWTVLSIEASDYRSREAQKPIGMLSMGTQIFKYDGKKWKVINVSSDEKVSAKKDSYEFKKNEADSDWYLYFEYLKFKGSTFDLYYDDNCYLELFNNMDNIVDEFVKQIKAKYFDNDNNILPDV